MAVSNHTRVGKVMDLLKTGVRSFVERDPVLAEAARSRVLMARINVVCVNLLALATLAAAGAPAARADRALSPIQMDAPARPDQPAPTLTYRLAETWQNAPWSLTAGRYGRAADISSAPDGTTFVLDLSYNAIHVLHADGSPRHVFAIPVAQDGRLWAAVRLDVGFDGGLYVMRRTPSLLGQVRTRVDVFAVDGVRGRGFETDYVYNDLAVGPDGHVYLSSATGLPRVDVFDGSGGRLASFGLSELAVPGALDVAADGTVYVVNHVPDPGTGGTPAPGPVPTREPSEQGTAWRPMVDHEAPPPGDHRRAREQGEWLSLGPAVRSNSQSEPQQPTPDPTATPPVPPTPAPAATEGVAIFEADYSYRLTAPFNGATDVAVGSSAMGTTAVFVSRDLEIFTLGDPDPVYAAPYPTHLSFFGGEPLHIDVAAGGRLSASLWHCYFQGVVAIADPSARPARGTYAGALDAPPLEGPAYPFRLAMGDDLAVLQGRFAINGDRPDQTYHPASISPESEPQSVQRWSPGGQLTDQLGLCAGGPYGAEVWWAADVAADGREVYTLDPRFIQRRADAHFPAWSYWPGELAEPGRESRLAALAADAGRVAAIDVGLGRVLVLDQAGAVEATWPFAAASGGGTGTSGDALPIDIALSADRVYLAEGGGNRIAVRSLSGAELAAWPTHDRPLRIAARPGQAAGSGGDLYILGRGGYGYQYTPDGKLRATWPMPDTAVEPLDIAVGSDGRVYISFVRRELMREPRGSWTQAFTEAGIWVFEPAPGPAIDPPAPGGCLAWPDKIAVPDEIPLGDTVEVTLTALGRCPGRVDPAQIAIVFDTSRSMSGNSALERAREAVLGLLGGLDSDAVELALVTFADGAALATPLGHDAAGLAARVTALQAVGDTRMGAGIDLARTTLAGARRDPPARQVILLVTDGGFKDQPTASSDRARVDGIEIFALVTRTEEFMGISSLVPITGSRERVILDPDRWALADLGGTLVANRAVDGLFETATVRDVIPANMRYVPDSAVPDAVYDPAGHTLTWTLADVPALGGVRLSYRLEPLEIGTWPTNVEAAAVYRDALGSGGRLLFPIPRVRVFGPAVYRAYLPFGAARACFRSGMPLDVVLVLDASLSMDEPAGDGRTKLEAARSAAGDFVDLLQLGQDQVAVIAFHSEARRVAGLTRDREVLRDALAAITTASGTRIDRGLAAAWAALIDGGRRGARPVVILLTDGLQAAEAPAGVVLGEAARLKAAGALVYTIGLGNAIDRPLLAAVAGRPEDYFESPTAGDLARIYGQIIERLACAVP
jgi:Mg-chelatase subunit ChlD